MDSSIPSSTLRRGRIRHTRTQHEEENVSSLLEEENVSSLLEERHFSDCRKFTSVVRETRVSRQNGDPIKGPLKPFNTIVL